MSQILRKTRLLKNIINSKKLEFIMEAHNGISSKIVEETGFKAIWASGLTMSASMGLRDNNEASWCQVLNNLEYMSDATKIPILVDGDSGYGDFNNARRYVRKLEERGIAGVCFEDKLFPKTNSFINGENQDLADIEEFSSKILACKEYQRDPDFCVVARLESFITGRGLEDALERADSYSRSGADAILVHSKKKDASDILNFVKYWTLDTPLIIVPTKYWETPTQVFKDANISSIIWANHNMRSIIKTMKDTSKNIYDNQSLINIENSIEPVEEIFRLQNAEQLTKDEEDYSNLFYKKGKKNNYYIPNKNKYSTVKKLNSNKMNEFVKNDIKFENNIFSGKYSKKKYHTDTNLTELKRDFLECDYFYNELKQHNIDFYTA
jgi:phosphoenolpyruvate phosphomutase